MVAQPVIARDFEQIGCRLPQIADRGQHSTHAGLRRHAVAARAVRLVTAGTVQTVDGREITVRADTLCIHGDAPAAVAITRATRTALHDQGIAIRPPA